MTHTTKLADYRLQWVRTLKGSDWSGLAYDARRAVLYAVRNSSFRLRVLSPTGAKIRDIKGEGFEDVEDVVLIGYTADGAARLVLLEEKRWCLVLIEVSETTKRIERARCPVIKIGERTGNRGLEGIAFDGVNLYAAKEKSPMRILRVPLASLDEALEELTINESVGKGGVNSRPDVELVQDRLTHLGYFSGAINGRPTKKLSKAIENLQGDLGFGDPDGRVDPGGRSERGLNLLGLTRRVKPKDVTDRMLGAHRPKDISGLWWAGQSLVVLSHESRSVTHVEGIGAKPNALSLEKGSVCGLNHDVYQAEGIAFGADGALYIASEGKPNRLYMFAPMGKSDAPRSATAPTGLLPARKGWACELEGVADLALPGSSSIYPVGSLAHIAFSAFNYYRSAKRFYDWQDPLDGYTWGGGHWPLKRLFELWRKMSGHAVTWDAVVLRFREVLKSRPDLWRDAGGSDVHCTTEAVRAILKTTILSADWHKPFYPYTRSKHKGRRMYDVKWLRKCWAHAMLDPQVAVWTADHWRNDQLMRGVQRAHQCGAATIGGVCSFVSANSSRSGWAKDVARQLEKGGRVTAKSVDDSGKKPVTLHRTWKQKAGEPWADWCSRVAWQYYTFRKLDVRSRMRRIWDAYYSPSYGPISKDDEAHKTWKSNPKWLAAMTTIDLDEALVEAQTSLL